MQMGMIGLGRMGGNIVRRLMKNGHSCVVYDRSAEAVDALAKEGGKPSKGLEDMVKLLAAPRVVWVMLPAGKITDDTVMQLGEMLSKGDIVIDGGNSFWQDDIRRGKALAAKGIHYVDVGTSGGVWGLDRGYCMMIGGAKEAVDRIDPILDTLAPGMGDIERTPRPKNADSRPERGYMHCGPVGAGHFVKMVHNGIEYGLMQAYAEGFDIIKNANSPNVPADHRYEFNLPDIAEVWRRGSVVASWLLDLSAIALADNANLENFTGSVSDSGEGRWTLLAAIDEAVPCDVLSAALYVRFRSRQDHTFAEKLLSAMRMQFGGHVEQH
jgi:6-phosphogluconate dehydrogenase